MLCLEIRHVLELKFILKAQNYICILNLNQFPNNSENNFFSDLNKTFVSSLPVCSFTIY